jgi:mono/diheme cytochrome c family protein
MKRAVVLVLLVAGAGCGIPETGPMMAPGENCLECHGGGGGGEGGVGTLAEGGEEDGKRWSFAGTVVSAGQGVENARIHVTDANGWSFTIRSNQAGNFYSAENVAFPLHVVIDWNGNTYEMTGAGGACNGCHGGGVPLQ